MTVATRLRQPIANVQHYGALGNGVHDDTAGIQAAIDAASSAGRGDVFFPMGTYLLNGPRTGSWSSILIAKSNVRLTGTGTTSVIKVADGYTAGGDYRVLGPMATEAINNFTLENLCFDGNAASNIVLGSAGGNVRRAFSLYVDNGDNIVVTRCLFRNHPGRNVIVCGNNSAVAHPCSNVKIEFNEFRSMGGAISGNELQNDHSSVYIQSDGGRVANNDFLAADTPVDYNSVSFHIAAALEIHGSYMQIVDNTVRNYTHGGNAVASGVPARGVIWSRNHLLNCTNVGMTVVALNANDDLAITDNLITLTMGTPATPIAGIYQSSSVDITREAAERLMIARNTIVGDDLTASAKVVHGIQLCAVAGGTISDNKLHNLSGNGILLVATAATTSLELTDLEVAGNDIKDCGFNTGGSQIFGIVGTAASATQGIHRLRIHHNRIRRTDSTSTTMRGIRLTAGVIEDATVEDNRYFNLPNVAQFQDTSIATNHRNVNLPPRRIHATTGGADPTSGMFLRGDQVLYTDTAASGFIGKVAVNSGAAHGGNWATATAYAVGDWRRFALTGKVGECVVAGTSHAGTEPNPTTLGATVVDGAVTWIYRASAATTFKTFGVISA